MVVLCGVLVTSNVSAGGKDVIDLLLRAAKEVINNMPCCCRRHVAKETLNICDTSFVTALWDNMAKELGSSRERFQAEFIRCLAAGVDSYKTFPSTCCLQRLVREKTLCVTEYEGLRRLALFVVLQEVYPMYIAMNRSPMILFDKACDDPDINAVLLNRFADRDLLRLLIAEIQSFIVWAQRQLPSNGSSSTFIAVHGAKNKSFSNKKLRFCKWTQVVARKGDGQYWIKTPGDD